MTLNQKVLLYVAVFIVAFGIVFLMDSITTEYEAAYLRGETDERTSLQGDQGNYVKLAEDAGFSNGDVLGPFAYRIIPGMIAYILSVITNSHVIDGYHIMTFVGLGLQLVMSFVLARELGANIWQSFFVMLIVALSAAHVRIMTYDYIRPDALAYPWLLAVVWLILRGNLKTAMVLSWLGVIAREYFLLTAGIISIYYLWQAYQIYRNPESKQKLWRAVALSFISSLGAMLVFMLPRWLIETPASYQFLLTTEQGGAWEGFLFILQSGGRNKNYIMAFVGYMFPSIMLFSLLRFRAILPELRQYVVWIVLYSLGILALGYIGGMDLTRYAPYLIVPQIILVVLLVKNGVVWWELTYILLLWAWYNRLHQPLPGLQTDQRGYFIFVSPWGMSVPKEVSDHFKIAVVFILILWGIRALWYMFFNWRKSYSQGDTLEEGHPAS